MAHDARVREQTRDVLLGEARHPIDLEPGKHLAKRVALAEDGQPAEPGLKAFETDLFEEPVVVGDRPAPLLVVIPHVKGIGAAPPAAGWGQVLILHFLQRVAPRALGGATPCKKCRIKT